MCVAAAVVAGVPADVIAELAAEVLAELEAQVEIRQLEELKVLLIAVHCWDSLES